MASKENTIFNAIPNLSLTKGMLGVEIEIEGVNLPKRFNSSWRVDKDDSLKTEEAHEYVMPEPMDLAGVRKYLDILDKAFKSKESVIHESVRAGVHVHLNMQQHKLRHFFTFVSMYYVLEEVLLTYCGPNREGNLFCLRVQDAEYVLFQVRKTAMTRNFKHLNSDLIRYSSLNLYSLFKYGSVEFRAMRSTADLDRIYEWVEIVWKLSESAKKFKSPESMVNWIKRNGEVAFLQYVLEEKASLFYNLPRLERRIKEGVRRTNLLAYCTDWEAYRDERINPFQ